MSLYPRRVARAHGWRATLWGVGFVALSATLPMPVLADSPPVAPHLPGQYYRSRAVAKLPDTAPPAAPSVPPAAEAAAEMTLADAISLAYRSNPTLEAGRYDLAATDQSLGLALSELRPTSELQVTGQYDRTEAGRLTQKTRFGAKSSILAPNSSSPSQSSPVARPAPISRVRRRRSAPGAPGYRPARAICCWRPSPPIATFGATPALLPSAQGIWPGCAPRWMRSMLVARPAS